MFFFIPERLVRLEYLNGDKEIDEEASDYHKEMTLAFFIANFGYTKRDFEELTQTEITFVMKAWENKRVLDAQLMANAFFNAYINANRKKGKKPIPLWTKKKKKKENVKLLKKKFDELLEYEKNNSNDWVKKIYEGRR